TAAMPPCAQRVEPSSMLTFVTTVTCRPASRRCSAVVSPATPEPTTTTSVVSDHPGAGARSRGVSTGRSMLAVLATASMRQRAGPQALERAGPRILRRRIAGERLVAAGPNVRRIRANLGNTQVRALLTGRQPDKGVDELLAPGRHRVLDGRAIVR